MSTHKTIPDLPPFTPRLEEFRFAEFHRQSLELLKFPIEHDQKALDLEPFQVKPPPPPPDPPIPLLPYVWYPKPIQAVRDWALGRLVPNRSDHFIGTTRTSESQRVMRPLLAGNGPVRIQGELGMGKTTMLSYIASHERTRQRYRRIWWFDDPKFVTQTLALALNLAPALIEPDLDTQIEMLHEALDDNTLLVIDNLSPDIVEQFLGLSHHLLVGIETPPEIIENDEELPIDPEGVVTLHHLPKADALELMADACGVTEKNQMRGQMRAWMAHIAKLLNGHPLAIVFAGALFREDGLPMERLVEIFSDRINPEVPDPHIAFELSLNALASDYATLLTAFGALPASGATIEALMTTANMENEIAVYRGLSFLAKRGFISQDTRVGAYYVAHPLIWLRMASHNLHASNNPFGERLRQWVLRSARRNREDAAAIYRNQREILYTLECAHEENLSKIVHQLNMTLGAYLREYAPTYLATDIPAPQLVGERARAMTLIGDGLKLSEKGDLDAAKEAFAEGLSHAEKYGSDHEIAESLVAIARYYDTIDDYAAATENMERAAKLVFDLNADHSLHIIRLGLAMMYRKQGRYKDALGVLDDSPDTQAERARIYRANQQYDLMIETLERGRDIKPYDKAEGYLQAERYVEALEAIADAKSTETIYLRAIIFHMQGDLDQAIRGYEMALEVVGQQKPLRIDILLGMATAYIIQGDLSKARKILIQALEVYPILEQSNELMKARIQNIMAALHLLDNDPEIAIKVAKEALESLKRVPANVGNQERADVYRTLGRSYWRMGNQEQALNAFKAEADHAQSLSTRDEKRIGIALHHLADLYQSTRQADRAIANYRRALTHKNAQHDPLSYFMTQAALHCVLLDDKRFDQALEVNRDAIKHLTAEPPADLQHMGYMLCTQVRALEELDQDDEAVRTLGRWLSTLAGRSDALQDNRPQITLLALNLGSRSLLASQRADEAQPFAETAVRIAEHYYPSSSVAWSTRRDLGQVYLDLKQYEQAIETLSPLLFDSVKKEPYTYALAYEATAIAQHQLGNLQVALDNLQSACQHHPVPHKQSLILERMAVIEIELDHIDVAIDFLQQAIPLLDREAFPGDTARILTRLARLLTGVNRYADSIEIYEDSLAMLRSMPDADAVHTARVYISLASSHEAQGQYPQAAIAYRNALDTLESARTSSLDDHRTTLDKLAGVQVAMKNYNDAIAFYLQAQSETELYGTPQELGLINASLADTYRLSRRYEEALYSYEDALALQPASEMPRERAASLRGYGQTLSLVGRLDEARAAWTEALTITTDAPALEIALTHRAIGQAYYAQEHFTDAERSFRDALDYHQPNKAETSETWRLLAKAIIADKRFQQAILPLQQALDIEKGLAQQVNGRIVETLDLLADAHENGGDFSSSIACHHEALVYTDRALQPIETSARFRTLGRLYIIQQRWRDAHTALEEALSIEFNHKPRSDSRIAQTLETIAKAYQSEGNLQKAAEAYKRMTSYANLNKSASDQLKQTLDTIQKFEGTLEAARHSIEVLERTADTELKDIVYVYALVAQSNAKLSDQDAANTAIDQLLTKLEAHAHELSITDERKQYRALAHVFEGSQAASNGDLGEARAHFQMALHDTTDQSMRWVIEQGLNSVQE